MTSAQQEAAEGFDEEVQRLTARLQATWIKSDEARAAERAEIEARWERALGGSMLRIVDAVKLPQLRNLCNHPRLNEVLVYALREGHNKIGRRCTNHPPDIQLNGIGVLKHHCVVIWQGDKVFMDPSDGSVTFVNGVKVTDKTEVKHNDRIWLGWLGNNYSNKS